MMMELMGLHVPGSGLRQSRHAAAPGPHPRRRAPPGRDRLGGDDYRPLGAASTRKRSSTPPSACSPPADRPTTPSIAAIARAAGIIFDWEDLDALSAAVPLIARVYPNGSGDVNAFHAAGGMAYVIGELLDAGLLHGDLLTVVRAMAWRLCQGAEPCSRGDTGLVWKAVPEARDRMLRPPQRPFNPTAACASSRAISAARRSRPARSCASAGRSRRRPASSTTRMT
jgi:phosphogluconate dehydratase